MYLKQLVSAGLAGVAEWRRMWNQDVLPFLRMQRLVAGHGIRIHRLPTGTVVEAVGITSVASGGSGVGEAQAYKVVQVPVGGVGVGLVQNIRFTGGGAGYETVGDPVPKFFCHIGGPLA